MSSVVAESRNPNILFVTHRVPYPPDKGDRIRTFHLLRWISRRASVHLACLADEPVDEDVIVALHRYCERVAVFQVGGGIRWARALGSLAWGRTATEGAFKSPALRSTLRQWAEEVRYDVALTSASSLAPYLRLQGLREVPAVIDLIDVDSQKWLDYADASRGPKSWLYRIEGRRLRRLERDLLRWTRAVLLVSEAEADLYRRFGSDGAIHAVTNGVDLDAFQPRPAADGQGCVFVGALDYRPNVAGACWFCRDVWPLIHRRFPRATVALVGRKPVPKVRRLADIPGVAVVGQVPDVRPYLADAAVVVVPLRIARGLQNKVLEALAMGKATVASPQSLSGLAVEPGKHVLAASSPEQWAEAVGRLLDNESSRSRLGEAGRRYVEENHGWDHCLAPLESILGLSVEQTSGKVRSAFESARQTG